jgi:UDP-N-acetylmuramate--alanine ligase
MVVEADESDRSFLYLLPSIAVVTNIDHEHLDHYRDLNEITSAFLSFVNKVPFYGAVVACVDAPWGERIRKLFPQLRRRAVTYGLDPGADVQGCSVRLQAEGSCFEVAARGKPLGSFSIRVPGWHNVQNALAAVAVGLELDLSPELIRKGLERFRGVDRRFQVKGEFEGVTIVDDYAHHPTEIRATLEAARLWGAQRLIVIFQPHRYTRTLFLMDDFANSFQATDGVYVLDIYPASEKPIPGVTSPRLVERMSELGFSHARYAPSEQAVIEAVLEDLRAGDLILTVGAGSVGRIGDALARAIQGRTVRLGAVQS